MKYRTLGRTGIEVSEIALGTGPISGLMTGDDIERQTATLRKAQQLGVNWIDTAAGYGKGQSETSLGIALAQLDNSLGPMHVATKVRITSKQNQDVDAEIRTSVEQSLERLGRESVTLLQLHNAVTPRRGDQATSLTPDDILRSNGVLSAFRQLQNEGLCRYLGITGTGDADSLIRLVETAEFDTIQIPFNLVNPTAGYSVPPGFQETNYGQIANLARDKEMGVFAIRVFAAGALLGNPPTDYTRNSPYFPLSLYQRDMAAADRMVGHLQDTMSLKEAALRFPLTHVAVTAAIVGVKSDAEINEVVELSQRGPIDEGILAGILARMLDSTTDI